MCYRIVSGLEPENLNIFRDWAHQQTTVVPDSAAAKSSMSQQQQQQQQQQQVFNCSFISSGGFDFHSYTGPTPSTDFLTRCQEGELVSRWCDLPITVHALRAH